MKSPWCSLNSQHPGEIYLFCRIDQYWEGRDALHAVSDSAWDHRRIGYKATRAGRKRAQPGRAGYRRRSLRANPIRAELTGRCGNGQPGRRPTTAAEHLLLVTEPPTDIFCLQRNDGGWALSICPVTQASSWECRKNISHRRLRRTLAIASHKFRRVTHSAVSPKHDMGPHGDGDLLKSSRRLPTSGIGAGRFQRGADRKGIKPGPRHPRSSLCLRNASRLEEGAACRSNRIS